MVVLVETIDAISRRLGRDVLYLSCRRKNHKERSDAKNWLSEAGFSTLDCTPFATNYIQIEAPASELYIDLKYDPTDENFKLVDSYFERPDGTPTFTGIQLTRLTLELALLNKEQDEPGYWDRVL